MVAILVAAEALKNNCKKQGELSGIGWVILKSEYAGHGRFNSLTKHGSSKQELIELDEAVKFTVWNRLWQ